MKKQTLKMNNPNTKLRQKIDHMLVKNLRLVVQNDDLKTLLVEKDKEIKELESQLAGG